MSERVYMVTVPGKRPDDVDMKGLFDDYDGVTVKLVPASELREREELIQRLCNGVERKIDKMSHDSLESEGADFLKLFGLRKTDAGRWEKCK